MINHDDDIVRLIEADRRGRQLLNRQDRAAGDI